MFYSPNLKKRTGYFSGSRNICNRKCHVFFPSRNVVERLVGAIDGGGVNGGIGDKIDGRIDGRRRGIGGG
jgi:hypothetical protein